MAVVTEQRQQECCYSVQVPEEEVQKHGCFTALPVRRHKRFREVDAVLHDLIRQWHDIIGDGASDNFNYTGDPVSGSWISLILPESNDETFPHSAWLTEFFFLFDDKLESMSHQEDKENVKAVHEIFSSDDPESIESETVFGKLLVPFVREYLRYDYKRGIPVLRGWKTWLELDHTNENNFSTLDDYITYRLVDIGMWAYPAMAVYHMQLDIKPEQMDSLKQVFFLMEKAIIFTNDYWSWPKEAANSRRGSKRVMNAVLVVMRELQIDDCEDARKIVKEKAIGYEKELLRLRNQLFSPEYQPPLTSDMRSYVDAHLWMVSGNNLWSSTCPRYHSQKVH
ncbi:hypothetical protein AKAW_10914 [Aspergillus luchuensis IFO 4308]|nr:hypothetical protein ALUC_51194S [Aspergillus luchuensis]GAA92801.1 hypothetical protein AKAW_10914 [Aspergillus luchuensis IFO 4308]